MPAAIFSHFSVTDHHKSGRYPAIVSYVPKSTLGAGGGLTALVSDGAERMPAFDYDVFISYAHIDNATLQKGQEGWIDMLHKALELRLGQLLGEAPRIWRDQKLGGNDRFDDEIVDQLVKAAVLVAVLSPRYVKSDWCTKEVEIAFQGPRG